MVRGGLTNDEHLQFILELLKISRDADLIYQDCPFLWHVEDDRAHFSMACSDTFAWGCADAEDITPDDLPLLRQTFADLKAAEGHSEIWLAELYSARRRGMRPMNRWMQVQRREGMNDAAYALFCAAGPERESTWTAP
jgi:hypothetical protein